MSITARSQLEPARFKQVYRATIVDLEHIASTPGDWFSRLFVRLRGHPMRSLNRM